MIKGEVYRSGKSGGKDRYYVVVEDYGRPRPLNLETQYYLAIK